MVRVFIGFHGTSKASADMILLDKRFLPSNQNDIINIPPVQIQICVKEERCIKSIEQWRCSNGGF